ncbi:uncharacterized protein CMU_009890 [Cryptosporidium muris RN66]|uniref:Homologous-pairing protein 2 winged helix domain-containing protein n=1 Tax=Cryptosporidium muris (strain RN66) TaxID=441375 RepID=B6AE56_CRYMR|nr:uncharacterized protein CMU_009890 [Cryptosporidium muris RN66]EEA06497.1 hypothetical protein, conserved [Cryptosporidium muris RN66]|eukprot:XP_002140846.1 hypothetical protein [Cryptosporidium muris RN66]
MGKRSEDNFSIDEDESETFSEEEIIVKKNVRPVRNTRKKIKYTIDNNYSDNSEYEDFEDILTERDIDDFDQDNLSDIQPSKIKSGKKAVERKPTAPKNLSKRNVANTSIASTDIQKAIYDYMKIQNRPYSIQNVVDNLHNIYSKKQVTEEMERLAVEGKFICKEYGKQKVYLVNQSEYQELNKEEMAELDKEISNLEDINRQLEIRLKSLKQETRNLSAPIPLDVLDDKISQMELKNSELLNEIGSKEKLIGDNTQNISIDELQKLKSEYQSLQARWKKYKNACKQAIDILCESMDQKVEIIEITSDLLEEIGIELDP